MYFVPVDMYCRPATRNPDACPANKPHSWSGSTSGDQCCAAGSNIQYYTNLSQSCNVSDCPSGTEVRSWNNSIAAYNESFCLSCEPGNSVHDVWEWTVIVSIHTSLWDELPDNYNCHDVCARPKHHQNSFGQINQNPPPYNYLWSQAGDCIDSAFATTFIAGDEQGIDSIIVDGWDSMKSQSNSQYESITPYLDAAFSLYYNDAGLSTCDAMTTKEIGSRLCPCSIGPSDGCHVCAAGKYSDLSLIHI